MSSATTDMKTSTPAGEEIAIAEGVSKRILVQGTGSPTEVPEDGDRVRVLYSGRLPDAQEPFDENLNRSDPFVFKLGMGEVIKGWDLAVRTMRLGERAQVTIASELAYGSRGSPPKIPPNSTLVFEIELLGWHSGEEVVPGVMYKTRKPNEDSTEWQRPGDLWEVRVRLTPQDAEQNVTEMHVDLAADKNLLVASGPMDLRKLVDLTVRKMKCREQGKLTIEPGVLGNQERMIYSLELLEAFEVEDLVKQEEDYGRVAGRVIKKVVKKGEGWESVRDAITTVKVKILGKFVNPTNQAENVFMDHMQEPVELAVNKGELPEGLDLALSKMKRGEVAEIRVHPDFGYPERVRSAHNYPIDHFMHFHVEMDSFQPGKESWGMSQDEKLEDGHKLRELGNQFFKDGKWVQALRKYNKAWKYFQHEPKLSEELQPRVHQMQLPCHLNLAAVHLKLQQYLKALEETDMALKIDPVNQKALYRRATAYFHRQEYDQALETLGKLLKINEESVEARNLWAQVKRKKKQIAEKERQVFGGFFGKVRLVSDEELAAMKKVDEPSFPMDTENDQEESKDEQEQPQHQAETPTDKPIEVGQ